MMISFFMPKPGPEVTIGPAFPDLARDPVPAQLVELISL
jgi:hypothetical protein